MDWYKEIITAGVPASIQDFSVRIEYDQLSDADKSIPYIYSLVQAEYEMYYEEKMALYSEDYGMDTISAMDFDTLYYPDSMYTVKSVFTALIDPSTPYALDLTNYLITADVVFLMTVRDMATINENSIADFKAVLEGAKEKNIPFFVLCSAGQSEIDELCTKYGLDATYLTMDGVEIKIIIRSNPGLVLLKKGTVMDKWPSRSIEDFEDIYEDYIQTNDN